MKKIIKLGLLVILLLIMPNVFAKTGNSYFQSYWNKEGQFRGVSYNGNIVSDEYGFLVNTTGGIAKYYFDGTLINKNTELEGSVDFAYIAKDNYTYVFTRSLGKTYIYKLNKALEIEKKTVITLSEDLTSILKYIVLNNTFFITEHSETTNEKTIKYIDLMWSSNGEVKRYSFADDFSISTYDSNVLDSNKTYEDYYTNVAKFFDLISSAVDKGSYISAKDYTDDMLAYSFYYEDKNASTLVITGPDGNGTGTPFNGKISFIQILDNYIIVNIDSTYYMIANGFSEITNISIPNTESQVYAVGGKYDVFIQTFENNIYADQIGLTPKTYNYENDVKSKIESIPEAKNEETIEKEEVLNKDDIQILVQITGNGIVNFDDSNLKLGETVKLDVNSEDGYKLTSLTLVNDDGSENEIENNEITINSEKITIKAVFEEDKTVETIDTIEKTNEVYKYIIGGLLLIITLLFGFVLGKRK